MKVIIPHPQNLENLKSQFSKDGVQKLHVVSDFDRTLTYGTVDGVKTPSIISMLRDGNHLTAEYAKKANALFDFYHPIEINPQIPLEQKKKLMQEWWETHNKLLIESGLNKADLVDIVKNGHVKFREGVLNFLDTIYEHQVPLIVFSASGCGDAIQLFFKQSHKDYPNIFYITNQFNWDDKGQAISTKEPVIHALNKDETIVEELPAISQAVKERKNVMLLGDSVGDLGMVKGFNYQQLLMIGFSNFDFDQLRSEYEQNFDVVLEGDGDFNFVNQLLAEIINLNS